jgi:hypothetical protein
VFILFIWGLCSDAVSKSEYSTKWLDNKDVVESGCDPVSGTTWYLPRETEENHEQSQVRWIPHWDLKWALPKQKSKGITTSANLLNHHLAL